MSTPPLMDSQELQRLVTRFSDMRDVYIARADYENAMYARDAMEACEMLLGGQILEDAVGPRPPTET